MDGERIELNNGVISAVLPWFSKEATAPIRKADLPQQRIDICLMCQHCADHCENCKDWMGKRGRPKKPIDMALLREMLQLRKSNREMCAALGVGKNTLVEAKKQIMMEDKK